MRLSEVVDKPKMIVKTPSACSNEEIKSFARVVASGGEVAAEGLMSRVRAAYLLAFLYLGRDLIGVSALKRPNEGYRDAVFFKAHADDPEKYNLELGWLFVAPRYRGQGYSEPLIRAVLSRANAPVFATSAATNHAVHKINQNVGLMPTGEPYAGTGGRMLVLFTLNAGAQ